MIILFVTWKTVTIQIEWILKQKSSNNNILLHFSGCHAPGCTHFKLGAIETKWNGKNKSDCRLILFTACTKNNIHYWPSHEVQRSNSKTVLVWCGFTAVICVGCFKNRYNIKTSNWKIITDNYNVTVYSGSQFQKPWKTRSSLFWQNNFSP